MTYKISPLWWPTIAMVVQLAKAVVAVVHLKPELSIIIPVLNEAQIIEASLARLQYLRSQQVEILLADGGSKDATCTIADGLVDKIIISKPGRAKQMNEGARQAQGKILLFLHTDTCLPEDVLLCLQAFCESELYWGFFAVRLSGDHSLLRMVEWFMNRRSSLSRIATGDQCLFYCSEKFIELGAYPEIPLMEDIAICKQFKKHRLSPYRVKSAVLTSSRRWEEKGILSTIVLMLILRLAYFVGCSPQRLQKIYYFGDVEGSRN